MGLFDSIRVRYTLPGDPPAFTQAEGFAFQTKDLDCSMSTYEIAEDGRLVRLSSGCMGYDDGSVAPVPFDVPFHGDLAFYQTNIRACGRGTYTADGEDAEGVTYRARFDCGRVIEIVEVERTREPALPMAVHPGYPAPTSDEIAESKALESESLVGRTMFVLWGGSDIDSGYPVEVVAEGPYEWVARKADGRMEVLQRWSRGRTLFDGREQAEWTRREEMMELDRERAEYERLLKERVSGLIA